MRFLIMTDIEGVTGVTTYEQAENSVFGKQMLMNDLKAVIEGIRAEGPHEIVVYDMHTDGRNVDILDLPEDVPVVMGKPILPDCYRGVGGNFDGLFMVGLHAMSKEPGAMLAHSYLREYDAIHINGELVGEIGVERALAGEQGFPLLFVSGDDFGCKEALALDEEIVTVAVKDSLDEAQALCRTPLCTQKLLKEGASLAVKKAGSVKPKVTEQPVKIEITFSDCRYLKNMKSLYPAYFVTERKLEICGEGLLKTWSRYLKMEKEMLAL